MGRLIVVLILGCLLALGIHSCSSRKRAKSTQAIEDAISFACKALAEAWNFEVEQGDWDKYADLAAAAEEQYIASMYSYLSTAHLPEDFKNVILQHISAHSRYAAHFRNHPILPRGPGFWKGLEVSLSGFILSGRFDGGGRAIMSWAKEGQRLQEENYKSAEAILQCAISNGVKLPTASKE